MKMTKRAICLLLAAVMALALTIPVVAMDEPDADGTKTITLDPGKEGTFPGKNKGDVYTVTLTEAGTLPDILPDPTREGWSFEGWYTEAPTEGEMEKVTSDEGYYYYKEVYRANGTQIKPGEEIPADTTTLFAYYTYRTVDFKMNANGWKNLFTALTCTRRVDNVVSKEDLIVVDLTHNYDQTPNWPGAVFNGWWTAPEGGEQIIAGTMTFGELVTKLTKGANDIPTMYAHWSRNGFTEETDSQYYDVTTPATGFKFHQDIASDHYIHYGATLSYPLLVTSTNKGSLRDVEWSVTDDLDNGDLVTITKINDGAAVIVKAAPGDDKELHTAKITAKLGNRSVSVYVHVGHWYGNVTGGYAASCLYEGRKMVYCNLCNGPVEIKLPPLGHDYATKETVKATCTSPEQVIEHCSRCGDTKTTAGTTAAGHDFTETTTTGCTGTVTTKTCKVCGYKKVIETGEGTHTWSDVYTIDKDATCNTDGSLSYHCTNPKCPAVTGVTTIPATGKHNYGDWTIIKWPSHNEKGERVCFCKECGAKLTEILPVDNNIPGDDPPYYGGGSSGGGGGGSVTPSPSPSASPEPSESPSPSPEPGVTPAPTPVPVPVDPPKTNGGSGWSYDYDTGDFYYFVDGEPKANYWAKDENASQWGFWYYVGSDGKLATGLQYIENNNGTGWYFLQPGNADGCVGKMLTGWQWLGPEAGEGWFNTAHGGVNGQCTWTENWGNYDPATGLWEDGLSHK